METASKAPASGARRDRRRLLKRLGIGLAIALALFVLVVFVLPTPIARYIIESQLDELGIEHDGIETIDIDLWNSQVRAGPIGFRAGDAQKGRVGQVAFDYSFGALFKGRGFVLTFTVSGVDVRVARLADGSITLNGVNLAELGRKEEQVDAEPEPPAKGGIGFGFGVEQFEFRDGKLFFEDITGGSLTMDLDRLTVERLRTWSPEEPTRFSLEARLNEIELAIEGTVYPLADPLRVAMESQVKGITIDRLARFVGPTGLERRDGTLETRVSYDYAFHRDGRLEGTVDGTYRLVGLDVTTAGGDRVALDEAVLEVDLDQTLAADRSGSAAGRLSLAVSSLSMSAEPGDAIDIAELELSVVDLDLTKQAKKIRSLFEWTAGPRDSGKGTEGARSIVELVIGYAKALARDLLSHAFEIDGHPALNLKDGRARLAARGDTPAHEMRFAALEVVLGKFQSEAFDAGLRGSVGLATTITGLDAEAQDGAREAGISSLRLDSDAIQVSVTGDRTAVDFDVRTVIETLAASEGNVGSLALGKLSLESAGISFEETADGTQAGGPLVLRIEGLDSALSVGDESEMTTRGEAVELNLSSVSVAGEEIREARITGSLDATGLAAARSGATPLAFALASSRTTIEDVRIAPLNTQAAFQGGLTTTLSELSFDAGSDADALSASLKHLEHRIEKLRASGLDGSDAKVSLTSHVQLEGFEASLPVVPGQTAEATVASLAMPGTELAVEGKAVRAAGALEITGITARTEGENPQSVDLAAVSVKGLGADNDTGLAIERIELGALDAKLTRPLPLLDTQGDGGETAGGETPGGETTGAETTGDKTAGEAPAETGDDAGEQAAPAPGYRRIKLGELVLAPGSRVQVADKTVKPPVQTLVTIEKLDIGPVDTGAPETKTNLAAAMTVNEASEVSVEGWASPLSPEPELSVTSRLKALSLPPFSPYTAAFTGVNVESGILWTTANAKADKGKLDGKIDVRIDELFVTPISEEEAKAIEANTGLPVGFAVSILKDDKGVIELGFPVSGTVEKPELDFGDAINKALSGAMSALFPSNWFGEDGKGFDMKPAVFEPGAAELTAEGKAVSDQIASAFADKPNISLRACGRAARDDLLVMRGITPEPMPAPATTPPPEEPAATGDAASEQPAPPPAPPVAPPTEKEVGALLALAAERGAAVRGYLSNSHGIAAERVPECRSAYSIEDEKPPRVEFLF